LKQNVKVSEKRGRNLAFGFKKNHRSAAVSGASAGVVYSGTLLPGEWMVNVAFNVSQTQELY